MRRWAVENILLLAAGAGILLTTPLRRGLPRFTEDELYSLYFLWLLMGAVKALERKGFFTALARRLETRRGLGPKLVLGTFALAALVTNDVALLATLPLVLALRGRRSELAVLAVLAANAGSALTPFGNPQNLYLYLHYRLDPLAFVAAILPLSAAFLPFLLAAGWALGPKAAQAAPPPPLAAPGAALAALLLTLAGVLRLLPLPLTPIAALLVLLADRRAFWAIDYGLLLTLAGFFLLVDNLEALLPVRLAGEHGVFLLALALSQVLSNVPTAVFLAPFTDHWRALLWGVNAGGFGTPLASLANLIGLRLFLAGAGPSDRRRFLLGYAIGETLALLLAIALFLAFSP